MPTYRFPVSLSTEHDVHVLLISWLNAKNLCLLQIPQFSTEDVYFADSFLLNKQDFFFLVIGCFYTEGVCFGDSLFDAEGALCIPLVASFYTEPKRPIYFEHFLFKYRRLTMFC